MSKTHRVSKPATDVAPAQQDDAAVQQEVVTVSVPKVAPKEIARSINFGRTLVESADAAASAQVVKTAKGTNLSKSRVYGYDNGTGGGKVPTAAIIVVVADAKPPAGVTPDQWLLLQTFAGKSVTVAYDNQVASRSVRRAYRAGAIRFMGV